MNEGDKPTFKETILFFVLLFIFVTATFTLVMNGLVSFLSVLGKC